MAFHGRATLHRARRVVGTHSPRWRRFYCVLLQHYIVILLRSARVDWYSATEKILDLYVVASEHETPSAECERAELSAGPCYHYVV